jgi:hypothetical protein
MRAQRSQPSIAVWGSGDQQVDPYHGELRRRYRLKPARAVHAERITRALDGKRGHVRRQKGRRRSDANELTRPICSRSAVVCV